MWARPSHTLESLTKKPSNKVKFKWTKIEQDAFNEIKWILDYDALSIYLSFNERFKVNPDTRNFQL